MIQYYERTTHVPPMADKTLKRGPKGGVYYISKSGSRVYVDRSSLPNDDISGAVVLVGCLAICLCFWIF